MDDSKLHLIESAGFTYRPHRELYVNSKTKKIVALEDVEDRSKDWLTKIIADPNDSGEWKFCFSTPPTDVVRESILAELE